MSRNGSGTYSLPAGNPVTTGTTISSTTHNNTLSDIATALSDSLAKDGQTTPTADLPMGTYKHTGVGDATARTQYAKVSQVQDGGYATLSSVSGANTITANCAPAITAYAAGQFFTFVSAGANTGAVTLNINSLGAKAVTKEGTTALAAGDIASGAVVCVEYDGTRFQLVGGRSVQPLDALLTALAAQTTSANTIQAYSGADTPTLLTVGASSANVPLVSNIVGTQTIWIPAGAMVSRTTNGAASGTAETTTHKVMIKTLDFDTAADEHAQFVIRMPKNWDEGTLTFTPVWSHAATTTNFGVAWFLQAGALANDDALDTAFGTAVGSVDTGGTTNDVYIGPASSAMTVAGSPGAEEFVVFQIYRDVDDAGDTLAVDARLHGVTINYTTNALNDN